MADIVWKTRLAALLPGNGRRMLGEEGFGGLISIPRKAGTIKFVGPVMIPGGTEIVGESRGGCCLEDINPSTDPNYKSFVLVPNQFGTVDGVRIENLTLIGNGGGIGVQNGAAVVYSDFKRLVFATKGMPIDLSSYCQTVMVEDIVVRSKGRGPVLVFNGNMCRISNITTCLSHNQPSPTFEYIISGSGLQIDRLHAENIVPPWSTLKLTGSGHTIRSSWTEVQAGGPCKDNVAYLLEDCAATDFDWLHCHAGQGLKLVNAIGIGVGTLRCDGLGETFREVIDIDTKSTLSIGTVIASRPDPFDTNLSSNVRVGRFIYR